LSWNGSASFLRGNLFESAHETYAFFVLQRWTWSFSSELQPPPPEDSENQNPGRPKPRRAGEEMDTVWCCKRGLTVSLCRESGLMKADWDCGWKVARMLGPRRRICRTVQRQCRCRSSCQNTSDQHHWRVWDWVLEWWRLRVDGWGLRDIVNDVRPESAVGGISVKRKSLGKAGVRTRGWAHFGQTNCSDKIRVSASLLEIWWLTSFAGWIHGCLLVTFVLPRWARLQTGLSNSFDHVHEPSPLFVETELETLKSLPSSLAFLNFLRSFSMESLCGANNPHLRTNFKMP
jgi:hypothetical protein